MKHLLKKLPIALIILLAVTSQSFANWEAQKDPMGGDYYRLHNSKTGQTTGTTYDDKKKANKAAKILNKKDKGVMLGPDGQGDYRPGGNFPR